MDSNDSSQRDYLNMQHKALPNATVVLVLGILSLVVCQLLGIIGWLLANQDMRLYNDNPGLYSESSLSTLKAGKICSIIGTCLMGLGLLVIAIMVLAGRFTSSSNF
ncbi:MAG: hypothetical protein JWO92_1503 [Chitinophagaceae bacterium]|nr:hypothetical protein [Chitinophagaceae bacterium]